MHDLIIINDRGRRFGVRIVREGDRYGRDHCLVYGPGERGERWYENDPLVEFYDMTYASDLEGGRHSFGPRGQFVSRYYRSTLIEGRAGLCLDGGVAEWRVDTFAMDQVRRLLAHTIREEVTA